MFFKSLILGAVCAFMAGGAVYYSTLPSAKTTIAFGKQSAAMPHVQSQSTDMRDTTDTGQIPLNELQTKSQKQAQYQYEPENKEPKESGPRRWLDQYLKRKSEAEIDSTQGDVNRQYEEGAELSAPENNSTESEHGIADQRYAYEDIQSNQNNGAEPSRERSEDPIEEPVRNALAISERKSSPYITETGDVDGNIQIAMREISKISAPTISEQAYFSLVSYALSHGRFNAAEEAMSRIMTVEMRETARINMAVALAKNGQSDEAFAMVNAIEAPEYRDILRLQVIEALLQHKDTNEVR